MSWSLETFGPVTMWRPTDAPPGIVVAATTRLGGVSETPYATLNLGRSTADRAEAVDENRRRVLSALGLPPKSVATAGQVHGVRVTDAGEPGLHRETDALITRLPRLALAVSGADCLPLMLVSGDTLAAAHSGWRGTAAGMPSRVLESVLTGSGEGAGAVRVYLGPCIGPCCYRVGEDVAAAFPAESAERRDGGWFVDLGRAARRQLEAAGVRPERIVDPPACTSCSPAWCYSHRRDRGLTGRMWGLIARVTP